MSVRYSNAQIDLTPLPASSDSFDAARGVTDRCVLYCICSGRDRKTLTTGVFNFANKAL